MTEIIVQALAKTNQRGIIDKGWGGIGKRKPLTHMLLNAICLLVGYDSFVQVCFLPGAVTSHYEGKFYLD